MKPRIRIKQVWCSRGVSVYYAYDSNPHVDRLTLACFTPESAYHDFIKKYGEY